MCNSHDVPENMREIKEPKRKVFESGRADGRFTGSSGFIYAYLKHMKPKLAYDPAMTGEEFFEWREKLRAKLLELMFFPEFEEVQPPCKMLWSEPRKGYTLQKWEIYPEPYSVVPFLMIVPDGVTADSPAPGVLCFPGSFSSKESLCGELELDGSVCSHKWFAYNQMALEYGRAGFVSVAVENPATNEVGDPNLCPDSYEFSVHSMWAGRCYESISVYQKYMILQWLKTQPYVDKNRLATSGHSLGAKPAAILGLLDPDVKAVVWNDGICNWRKRAYSTNLTRIGTFQYIPGLLQWFDYPDMLAALAPGHLGISEGGPVELLDLIQTAFEKTGTPEHYKYYFYPKYEDPANRLYDYAPMPEGMTMEECWVYGNCDAPTHRFRGIHAVPFLSEILKPTHKIRE